MKAEAQLSKFAEIPPKADEKANEYYFRVGIAWEFPPNTIKMKVFRLLRDMGYDKGDRGFARLKQLLESRQEIPEKKQYKETPEGAAIEYEGRQSITSEQQAIDFFQIDTDKWLVRDLQHRSWDVTTKSGSVYTNYYTSVKLAPRKKTFEEIKRQLREEIPRINLKVKHRSVKGLVCEMMITDLHMGKMGFNPETLEFIWSPEQAAQVYYNAINHFVNNCPDKIAYILLPTGNDLLNINSDTNTTKRGTPQMTGEFFQRLFTFTRKMVSHTIETLVAQVAPVHVKMIPGNHDEDAVFHLGDALKARYEDQQHVHIDNELIRRKWHRFGQSLIGWDHGHNFRFNEAYKAVSQDRPRDFGETKYRYFRLGHLHKNMRSETWQGKTLDELNGVEVEICPALTPTDAWHYKNLYIGNIRRAKSFFYDEQLGKVQEVYYNL